LYDQKYYQYPDRLQRRYGQCYGRRRDHTYIWSEIGYDICKTADHSKYQRVFHFDQHESHGFKRPDDQRGHELSLYEAGQYPADFLPHADQSVSHAARQKEQGEVPEFYAILDNIVSNDHGNSQIHNDPSHVNNDIQAIFH